MAEERLQKILARAGFGSRRACEELITSGRVTVNGQIAELGGKADPQKDSIRVDGHKLKAADEKLYYAVYKPRGVLSTTAGPDPRRKVTDLVPGGEQLHLVGRLDLDSEGLMLLTNDGDLTQQLSHPRYEHEKEYRVLVARQPDMEQLATWRRGVVLPDGSRSLPAEVRIEKPHGKGAWLRVIMREGRKREIREITRLLGLPVVKLLRIRIGALRVGDLQPGQWRLLEPDEVETLRSRKTPLPFRRTPAKSAPTRSGRPAAGDKHPTPRGSRATAADKRRRAPASRPSSKRQASSSRKPAARRPSSNS
ncbi:MAG: pseudouridine synthase [Anaerolineales bacterium]|nr:pseudouridine synthase [Anaerolineales bacterium]